MTDVDYFKEKAEVLERQIQQKVKGMKGGTKHWKGKLKEKAVGFRSKLEEHIKE
ncbi:MAG: hypothetical protein KGJ07_07450 [Patescibacteria group bacterium]|nr:hypothetical protein [Patescibacteria group bacterium]MDE2590100.1 hypothetical protein [Patescibacteria group bacterium]